MNTSELWVYDQVKVKPTCDSSLTFWIETYLIIKPIAKHYYSNNYLENWDIWCDTTLRLIRFSITYASHFVYLFSLTSLHMPFIPALLRRVPLLLPLFPGCFVGHLRWKGQSHYQILVYKLWLNLTKTVFLEDEMGLSLAILRRYWRT